MPVIRPANRGEPVASLRGHLADLLVKELMGEGSNRGPVVFEIPTDRANTIDVIVVWEAWKSVPVSDRSSIIRDAYARYARMVEESLHDIDPSQKPAEPVVPPVSAIAIGATWADVVALNLLPFAVQPQARSDEADHDAIRNLMIEAGAIETPTGLQLRFPSAQMAADAHARLVGEMPEAHWAIVEEIGPVDDWSNA